MHRIEANGARIPAIGFGTWTLTGDRAVALVAGAIRDGYRHVDTAAMYDNETEVGQGIRDSGLARGEIFLTTKIWQADLADGDLQRSLEASLKRLGVDAVDLALIHWPSKTIPLADSIRALNQVADDGLARHIGVSNFPTALLEQAVAASPRPLACNQCEYHPFLDQDRVLAACRRHGMAFVSYCPLNRGGGMLEAEPVTAAAARHGKTPGQVALRWNIQQGTVAIPRSSSPERIRENLDVVGFELSEAEMAAIGALRSRNQRICDFDFSPDWDPV